MIAGTDSALPPIDLIQLDEIDSTSSEAARRLDDGVAGEFALLARRQTAGRGRHGRTWISPEGNLYMSAVIRPHVGMDRAGELAFIAAIAVGRALAATGMGGDMRFKWPNDILVHDAKLCGILIENRTHGAEIEASVIGIGVNVAFAPEGMSYPAAALSTLGVTVDCAALARTILVQLQAVRRAWIDNGFAAIAAEWNRSAWRKDMYVTVDNGIDRLTGIFAGLSATGALRLVTDSGVTDIYSGSLLYRDAA